MKLLVILLVILIFVSGCVTGNVDDNISAQKQIAQNQNKLINTTENEPDYEIAGQINVSGVP